MFQIATNQALNEKQRGNAEKRGASLTVSLEAYENALAGFDPQDHRSADPGENALQQEKNNQLRELVQRLPECERDVIELVYFQHLELKEAASQLDIPLGTVKSRLNRALGRLRERIGVSAGELVA